MQTLYTQQSRNVFRTWLLMLGFLGVIIGLGYMLAGIYGDARILYICVAFSLVMNIGAYWFSDKIVLSIAGAREATRAEYFDLYTSVENLAITAGLPMPRVYVIQDSAPNAFATGRNAKYAVVAVTTGLLEILDRAELEGVLAHELAHIGNRDMLISTVAVVLVGFVSIVSDMLMRSALWGSGNDRQEGRGGAFGLIAIVAGAILAPLAATLLHLAISRKREYLADATGALLTRYPQGLASALRKISVHSRPLQRQSDAIAHLYISDPKASALKKVRSLFATHPPIEKRIEILLQQQNEHTPLS